MDHDMPPSLLDIWVEENNAIVNKWKRCDRRQTRPGHDRTWLKCCYLESHKLLRKLQGVPAVPDHVQLELTAVYNSCVFSLSQTELLEAEWVLAHGLERALQGLGCEPPPPDPQAFWRAVLTSLGCTSLRSCTLQLLCMQWALLLATCRLGTIQDLREEFLSLLEGEGAGEGEERRGAVVEDMGVKSGAPLVVLKPRELKDLLQICTVIAQGAEWLSEGRCSEALDVLQTGTSLPAPRALLAHTHHLSGLCFARMGRPHSALQCYRRALEADSSCVCALHQSTLVYRQLGNTQAEVQALRLLHSTLMLPPATESGAAGPPLLCPDSLLRGQSLSSLLSVPSPLSILHRLALKSVLHGRVSEGVEDYLDLLAALQSDHPVTGRHPETPPLPRIPELYLEAGSALLMAQRPADCLALCDEVISTTLELLPERLLLEEPVEGWWESGSWSPDALGTGQDGLGTGQDGLGTGQDGLGTGQDGLGTGQDGLGAGQDRLGTVLWAGAAHLLQAHCYTHLKDWKQALTHYTRCINLLVKVCVKQKGWLSQAPGVGVGCGGLRGQQEPGSGPGPGPGPVLGLSALQRLKGLALAGRGVSFTHRDQLREALRDLQLSQQASTGCASTGLWLGEVLWRLGRRQEAAASWEKAWSSTKEPSSEGLPLYLQDPQTGPSLDPTDLRRRVEELRHSHRTGATS